MAKNATLIAIDGQLDRLLPQMRSQWFNRQQAVVDDDGGSAALYFVVITTAVLFATALVVDGGRKMSALSEAVHLADNGARACAQGVDEQAVVESDRSDSPVLDRVAATASADQYFQQAGVGSYNVGFDASDTECIVTVHLDVPSMAIPMGTVTATQSAVGESG